MKKRAGSTESTLLERGRTTIPVSIRRALGMIAGDQLVWKASRGGALVVHLKRPPKKGPSVLGMDSQALQAAAKNAVANAVDQHAKAGNPVVGLAKAHSPSEEVEWVSWDNAAPVGREFGSPDYERLEKLDRLAFSAFGSMKKAMKWLNRPHPALGGATPENASRTTTGFAHVKRLLARITAGELTR